MLFVLFLSVFFAKSAFSQLDSTHVSDSSDSVHVSDLKITIQNKGYIDSLNNINSVFSTERQNLDVSWSRIPVKYRTYIKSEMSKYNQELNFVIENLSKGRETQNINDVFVSYKQLRRSSNLLSNYNSISNAIELNYKVINTLKIYINSNGLNHNLINGLNNTGIELDNIVYDIERSLSNINSMDFENINSTEKILNSMKVDYLSLKKSYQSVSNTLLSTVEIALEETK